MVGKALGVLIASWIMVKLRFANLPTGANWNHIIGISMLAGIGFTVSIFVTELAFAEQQDFTDISKFSIFIASVISASLGLFVLRFMSNKSRG